MFSLLLYYLFKFSKTSDLLSNSWNIWFLLSIADSLYNFVIYYNELWIPDYDKKSNTLGPSEFLFWYQWYRWYWHRYFFIDLTSSRYFLVIILMIMVIILIIRKMLIMTIMMSKWWSWQWPALPEVASLPVCHPLSHFPRLEKHHHNHHHNHHHRHRHRHYCSHPNHHHHVVSSMCVMCFIIVSLCSCVLCPSRVLCSVSSMCHQHSWALATWRQEGTHQSAQLQILFSRSYKCSSLLSQHHTNVLLNFLQILFSRS